MTSSWRTCAGKQRKRAAQQRGPRRTQRAASPDATKLEALEAAAEKLKLEDMQQTKADAKLEDMRRHAAEARSATDAKIEAGACTFAVAWAGRTPPTGRRSEAYPHPPALRNPTLCYRHDFRLKWVCGT
jgi:hypothetical protein